MLLLLFLQLHRGRIPDPHAETKYQSQQQIDPTSLRQLDHVGDEKGTIYGDVHNGIEHHVEPSCFPDVYLAMYNSQGATLSMLT